MFLALKRCGFESSSIKACFFFNFFFFDSSFFVFILGFVHNWIHLFEFGIRLCNKYSTVNNFNKSGWGCRCRGSMQSGATPGSGWRWGSGRLTVGRHGRGRGSALSRRVAAWRVWADAYRGMAGAGRGKHKISTKEMPPWNGRWGVLLGGGLGGFGGAPASPLVRMWINLILGSISLHVTLKLFETFVII